MGTVKVTEIVKSAGILLNDVSNTRWKRVELQQWINDSYREIVNLRPDANAKSAEVLLAEGARQKLYDTSSINLPLATRILDVVRNVAASSSKNSVATIKREVLDESLPGWSGSTPSVNVAYWVPDVLTPSEFMVYPPATDLSEVEIIYSSVPAPHALTEEELAPTGGSSATINLDDVYANAILDYVLYRAQMKDAETGNDSRSAMHFSAFTAALQVKTSTDMAVTKKPAGAA